MSTSRLLAAADLRSLPYAEAVQGFSLTGLICTSSSTGENASWRALSNLIGSEWEADRGLRNRHAYWGPRASDARALGGRRTMTTGNAAAAGDLAIGSALLSLAASLRPQLVLERAGAVRREVGGVIDAVTTEWSGAGTGYWVGEGVDVQEPALTVVSGAITPRTCGAVMHISRRLAKQSAEIEGEVTAELRRLVAGTVEAAAFAGSGVESEPLGLINTPGATTVATAGAVPTYAELVDIVDAYHAADGDPDAAVWFVNPQDFTALMEVTVASGTGIYAATIGQFRYILGVRAYLTRHVPAGTVILTDPRNITMTYWRAPEVIRDNYTLDFTGSIRIVVFNDVNLSVRHRPQLVIGS